MEFFAIFLICLLSAHAISAAKSPSMDCVLDANGLESCTTNTAMLPTEVRRSTPCEKMDMKCWCMKAVDYTNDVRRRNGQNKMLKVGPMNQLENANWYAGVLGDKGYLEHQDLGDATKKVGCGRFIGGENIAYNFEKGDIAKACVDQWESSSGHLQNILRDSFGEVVVGFHYEADGRVYCVQTFTTTNDWGNSGSPSDANCESVDSDPGRKPTKPAPTKPTKPAPTEPAPTKPAPTKPTEPAPTKPVPTKPTKPTGVPTGTKKVTFTLNDKGQRLRCRCMCKSLRPRMH